jgi:hypothetical protein
MRQFFRKTTAYAIGVLVLLAFSTPSSCAMPLDPTIGTITVTVPAPASGTFTDVRVYFGEDSDDGVSQVHVADPIAFPLVVSFTSGLQAPRFAVTVSATYTGTDAVSRTVYVPSTEGGDFTLTVDVPLPDSSSYVSGWAVGGAVTGGADSASATVIANPGVWNPITFASTGVVRWFKVATVPGASYAFFQDRATVFDDMLIMEFVDASGDFLEENPYTRDRPVCVRSYESHIWLRLSSSESGTFNFGFRLEGDL